MATLTRTGRILIFDDVPSNRNPKRQHTNWLTEVAGLPVLNPQGAKEFPVEAGEEVTLFSGARALAYDATTQFALTLSPLDPSRYRLAWTGTGVDPAFRTARATAVSGGNLVLTALNNQSVIVTSSLGSVFGAVLAGDDVLIPGVATGDPAVFDPLNEGEWTVLIATAAQLTLARRPGAVFSAVTQTVAVSANSQFLAYSAAGVKPGDLLDLVSGFAASALSSYRVLAVSSKWVEFVSTLPLAAQTLAPGVSSLAIYSSAKRWFYLETDQEVAIKLNGATGENDRVQPIIAGDENQRGWREQFGPVYSLVVKNRSTARATVVLASVE